MQAPTRSRVGGYSDFFSSGFRITSKKATTTRPRPVSTYSISSISPTTQTPSKRSSFRWQSTETNEKTGIRSPKLHQDLNSSSSAPSSSTDKQRRRSSFIEFSTKLFDKITPGVSEPRSFMQFDDTKTRRRPHIRTNSSDWPNSPTTHNSSFRPHYSNANSIDPFSSSPDSKSFFIDLSDSSSSVSVPARARHQSYISFSGSSLHSFMSFSKRERATSIHSIHSLPPQAYPHGHGPSRNSGSYFIPTNSDKFDHSFPEESSSILESPYENGEDGDLSNIDWREFHIQLFDNV
ncbi:hypothetical protein BDP27DRAFT_1365744 [Rhodocollybia butyracea]|uniref:Uncharacterized protein n=1 Tax=Rhodocollybia butyracea TaxID=206335 RepID=A0A9P5U609_9AGAR|nr:hypothetical protein BDP27DRAFT_1365744 [Rhodocollybia butyracea]